MSIKGWFIRFNIDGSRFTYEGNGLYQNQYLNPITEICQDTISLVIGGVAKPYPPFNEIAAGGDKWIGLVIDKDLRAQRNFGPDIFGAGSFAISPKGTYFAYVNDRQADNKGLVVDGFGIVASGSIIEVRISEQALVWSIGPNSYGILTKDLFIKKIVNLKVTNSEEYRPIPIDTPDGPWVLNHTQTGIILRPFGEYFGYRFDNGGNTFFPDGVYINNSIKVGFSDGQGNLTVDKFFSFSDKRIDLRNSDSIPVPEPIPPTPIPIPIPEPTPEPPDEESKVINPADYIKQWNLPSLDHWLHVEFIQLVEAFKKSQPPGTPFPDDWQAFQTYRRYVEPHVWTFEKMLAWELSGGKAPVNPQ